MESDLIAMIGQLGFPIAVASYTLIVLNQTIRKNTECLIKMQSLIESMTGGKIIE